MYELKISYHHNFLTAILTHFQSLKKLLLDLWIWLAVVSLQ